MERTYHNKWRQQDREESAKGQEVATWGGALMVDKRLYCTIEKPTYNNIKFRSPRPILAILSSSYASCYLGHLVFFEKVRSNARKSKLIRQSNIECAHICYHLVSVNAIVIMKRKK